MSALAVASFVCGALVCCPVASLAAPLLGLAAIVSISRSDGRRTGLGWAAVGTTLGAIVLAGEAALVRVGYREAVGLGVVVEQFVAAVQAGDADAARAWLSPRAARLVTDSQFAEFVATLQERHGEFLGADVNFFGEGASLAWEYRLPDPSNPVMPIPLDLPLQMRFTRGPAVGLARFNFDETARPRYTIEWLGVRADDGSVVSIGD